MDVWATKPLSFETYGQICLQKKPYISFFVYDMKQLPGISLEYSCGVQRVTDTSGELNK
jgi:hypothetical protein